MNTVLSTFKDNYQMFNQLKTFSKPLADFRPKVFGSVSVKTEQVSSA